jgi:hypothetical protein
MAFKDRKFVPVGDGTFVFPERLRVLARYPGGPLIEMELEVVEGRPEIATFSISRVAGGSWLEPSFVHDLPLARLKDHVVERSMSLAVEVGHISMGAFDILLPMSDEPDRAAATKALRGRPIRTDTLHQVVNIVRSNDFDHRKQIARELHVSDRTASRYIAEARRRGLLEENRED